MIYDGKEGSRHERLIKILPKMRWKLPFPGYFFERYLARFQIGCSENFKLKGA